MRSGGGRPPNARSVVVLKGRRVVKKKPMLGIGCLRTRLVLLVILLLIMMLVLSKESILLMMGMLSDCKGKRAPLLLLNNFYLWTRGSWFGIFKEWQVIYFAVLLSCLLQFTNCVC